MRVMHAQGVRWTPGPLCQPPAHLFEQQHPWPGLLVTDDRDLAPLSVGGRGEDAADGVRPHERRARLGHGCFWRRGSLLHGVLCFFCQEERVVVGGGVCVRLLLLV